MTAKRAMKKVTFKGFAVVQRDDERGDFITFTNSLKVADHERSGCLNLSIVRATLTVEMEPLPRPAKGGKE